MRIRKPKTISQDDIQDRLEVMDEAALRMLIKLGQDARKALEKRAKISWEKAHTKWQNAQSRRLNQEL